MILVRQKWEDAEISDVAAAVSRELERPEIERIIRTRGPRVALGVGSRGIDRIGPIVRAVADGLKRRGAEPFLVPAMGSHGGASPEGQRRVLEEYGVDEERMGIPIRASMAARPLGVTPSGITVYLAEDAWDADWIVPINRVKPHTDFEGPIQSGLCKLLGVGFGKQIGCMSLHEYGTENFGTLLPEVFEVFRASGHVGFGLAIVENACDRTMLIRAVEGSCILEEEKELLKTAKAHMAKLPLQEIDVLVVEEFGKDISGAGMDTNITGRTSTGPKRDYQGPEIRRIVVLGLTEKTHGNACAISCADFITKRLLSRWIWRRPTPTACPAITRRGLKFQS